MSIRFTDHAVEQMIKRYLDELDIMRTIAFPDESYQDGDATVSRKTMGMKHIKVVWHRDEGGNFVVHTII